MANSAKHSWIFLSASSLFPCTLIIFVAYILGLPKSWHLNNSAFPPVPSFWRTWILRAEVKTVLILQCLERMICISLLGLIYLIKCVYWDCSLYIIRNFSGSILYCWVPVCFWVKACITSSFYSVIVLYKTISLLKLGNFLGMFDNFPVESKSIFIFSPLNSYYDDIYELFLSLYPIRFPNLGSFAF